MKVTKDIFLKLETEKILCINFIMIYHLYQKKMKIQKVEKLVASSFDKKEYVIHIRNLKQASNHGLILKNVCRVIKFNQKD